MTDTQAEASIGEAEKVKQTRRAAGVGFPSMPLGDAVALVKKIASYGTVHTDAAVASFLGHSTANSGPFRSKLAALKDYGLLSGRSTELAVTPLALEIVHPGLEADPHESLKAAFLKCKVFAAVLDALPKDHDLEVAGLANTAMHNHGVAPQSKEVFAASFVKSGVLAGLIEEVDAGRIRIPSASGGSSAAPTQLDEQKNGDTASVVQPNPAPSGGVSRSMLAEPTNAVVSHSWPISGGAIRFTIESSVTLPASAYAVIGSVIAAGDKLAELLTPAPDSDATAGATADPE
ncbi:MULTISPECIES: hypothetical protein [unclassified Microbacterium]|uniref:hypothetical protein n=1 Tax=unclassified Microbacterium TaxID=2609290 RepID=UPI0030169229